MSAAPRPAAAPGPTLAPSNTVIDGPSADIQSLSGIAVARDGSGGLIYLKDIARRGARVRVAPGAGQFRAPQQVDPGLALPSSQPVIAAADPDSCWWLSSTAGRCTWSSRPTAFPIQRSRRAGRRGHQPGAVDGAFGQGLPGVHRGRRGAATSRRLLQPGLSGHWSPRRSTSRSATTPGPGTGGPTLRPPATASGSWPGGRPATSTPAGSGGPPRALLRAGGPESRWGPAGDLCG